MRALAEPTFPRPALFHHERTPDPTWARELERLAPRSELLTWLHIAWHPGTRWCPVQRWVIYEMVPYRTLYLDHHRAGDDGLFLPELNGPDPRARGRWARSRTGHFLHDEAGRPGWQSPALV